MFGRLTESRSDNDYGQPDSDADEPFWRWYDILLFPVYFVVPFVFLVILFVVPILGGIWLLLTAVYSSMKTKIKSAKSPRLFLVCLGILVAVVLAFGFFQQHRRTSRSPTHPPKPTGTAPPSSVPTPTDTTTSRHAPIGTAPHSNVPVPTGTTTSGRPPTSTTRAIPILLDDFQPQPYQGESVYYFNRLGGDRGAVNNSILDWGNGQVTTTISPGNSWGGVWMSLNHPIREELPINFSAILPAQVLPPYQQEFPIDIKSSVHPSCR